MSHYFIADDTLASKKESFKYNFKGKAYTFVSDSGLFSMGHVDFASDLLMHQLPELSGRLLDLGCGYGPIGIVLGKTYGLEVVFSDINARALRYTKENCALNDFSGQVIESDRFENVEGDFDTIVLNPPIHAGKEVIFHMYRGAHDHLTLGGAFYVVIQKKHGAESTMKELVEIFGACETLYKKKGFFVLKCEKK